jgi:bacterioferritin-associated ferredoxin
VSDNKTEFGAEFFRTSEKNDYELHFHNGTIDDIETTRAAGLRHRQIEGVDVIVCHCNAVTDRVIRKAVRNGARTRNDVVAACAANMSCGGCAPAIDEIIEAETGSDNGLGFTVMNEIAAAS